MLLPACQGQDDRAPYASALTGAPTHIAGEGGSVLERASRFHTAPVGSDPSRLHVAPLLTVRAPSREAHWGEHGVEVRRASVPVAHLGRLASDAAWLADARTRVSIGLSLEDMRAVPGKREGDTFVHEGAWRGGGDLLRRPIGGGFEDFVLMEQAPSSASIAYRIELEDASTPLRLVGRVLEILDAAGAPRLHMSPPRIVDARGRHHDPRVALEGCAADVDSRPPWLRPTTAAGARVCTLRIDWTDLPVVYPALLDPAWDGTDTMATFRFWHASTALLDGRALVTGTQGSDLTELYDPTTETFASAGVLPQGVVFHNAALRLPDGRVLVVGGYTPQDLESVPRDASALYDPQAGTWALGGALSEARGDPGLALLQDGRVLALSGEGVSEEALTSCEVYDAATDTWSPAAAAPYGTRFPGVAVLDDGKVLMAGGRTTLGDSLADTARYDPVADAWTSLPALNLPRAFHTLTRLPGGDALAVAGFRDFAATDIVERFSVVRGDWVVAAPMLHARHVHTADLLPSGRLLVTGGSNEILTDGAMRSTELYDAATDTWVEAGDMVENRCNHRTSVLGDGSVLVTGGAQESNVLSTAELFTLAATGTPCDLGDVCTSGFCVDGVCCDVACEGPCLSCSAAGKGGGDDGTCGPVAADTDPRDDCLDSGAACQDNGVCDGQGACAQYAGPDCTLRPCINGGECASGFCADAVCCDQACDGACRSCARATGALVDGECRGAAPGTSEASACAPYGCNSDGTCRDSCATVDDCAAPTVCSEAGRCESFEEDSAQADEGCGCRAAGAPSDRHPWVATLLLSLFVVARRRRAPRLA